MAGESPHYTNFIRTQPCAACASRLRIEVHHALYGTTYSPDEPRPPKAIPNARKGGAQKSHDWFSIPLCMKDHTPGLHKMAGFFAGRTGEWLETWEREQVEEMHRRYDAEFPTGEPVSKPDGRRKRARIGAGWTVSTIHQWLRREAPTRPAPVAAALDELASLIERDTL